MVGWEFESHLVDIAPVPLLARLERLDEGVTGGVEMGGGVMTGRTVAAANVAAAGTAPQVDPATTGGQAFDAAVTTDLGGSNRFEVRTGVGQRQPTISLVCSTGAIVV